MKQGKRLEPELVQKICTFYLKCKNTESTAKHFRVSAKTVAKYRKLGKWDKMIAEAQAQARESITETLAERYKDDIDIINTAVNLMVMDLKAKADAEEGIPWNAKDFQELIKLRQLLLGQPTDAHTLDIRQVDAAINEIVEVISTSVTDIETRQKIISRLRGIIH